MLGAQIPGRRVGEKLTLHLCLVDEQEFGGAAALELLGGAFVGTELLILPLMQGEQRAGKATEAPGARQSCQREFLQGWKEGMAPFLSPGAETSPPVPALAVPAPLGSVGGGL